FLLACSFYDTQPDVQAGPAAHLFFLANEPFGMKTVRYAAEDVTTDQTLSHLSRALDDLRRLGELDVQLNHTSKPQQ
ncbi:MAG: hypothetical protein M3347_11275, partial [Armatimonadota bacterium]|nr:hypothetical protein [Armatimonadota bacterium]